MRNYWPSLRLILVLITILLLVFTCCCSANILNNEISDDDGFGDDNDYDLELSLLDADDYQLPTASASDEDEVEVTVTKYEPNWSSLDSRPLPRWYNEAKIGIFIHWGVFSVPAFGGALFWKRWVDKSPAYVKFMKENYPPSFTYQDFGPQFTAQFYNASAWVELFAKAGARYVVLTSKHVEGFTNWPSKYSFGWNSMDVGPKRDLVGELAEAVKKAPGGDMKFGLYHAFSEFCNPLYLSDLANNFSTTDFVDFKTGPELYELVNNYQPDLIWSDADNEASEEYWRSKEFLAWLYNESPVRDTVVVNDRWGLHTACRHGGFYNCRDHYNPHQLQPHKWENAFTLDKSYWAYRADGQVADYRTLEELVDEVVTTVSCGGNVLLNVGPTKEGTIIPIMQERLLQLGHWLSVNGDAIYETNPWFVQNDTTSKFIWYTMKPKERKLFAIALTNWSQFRVGNPVLRLGSIVLDPGKDVISKIQLLGYPLSSLDWEIPPTGKGLHVHLPSCNEFSSEFKIPYGWGIAITFEARARGSGGSRSSIFL